MPLNPSALDLTTTQSYIRDIITGGFIKIAFFRLLEWQQDNIISFLTASGSEIKD